ncbi:PTS enzyme II glucose-specific transporter subunit factor IIABC [Staphylococcus epidermidis 528m]|nr:PTS enzyme II glucose-specific transporter subunit factor IIABC [Staphylococcus epidermidis 528m]
MGLPTQRISEEIPWTKQVGVEAQQREFPKKFHGQSKVGLGPQQREFSKKFHGQSKLGLGRRQGTMNSILV